MKFADKLFLSMLSILAAAFTVFGLWMLNSNFQRLLDKEKEQAFQQIQMLQYLFDISYSSYEAYGKDYAIPAALDSISLSSGDTTLGYFAYDSGSIIVGSDPWLLVTPGVSGGLTSYITEMAKNIDETHNSVYGIQRLSQQSYDGMSVLVQIISYDTGSDTIVLGIYQDISETYTDRDYYMRQYWVAVLVLLAVGALLAGILSRALTRPIENLGGVVRKIAAGDYTKRSDYRSGDEIGELAKNFDKMADALLNYITEQEQIAREKEEEARRRELEARQKEDFTNAFAHELKTPLASIIGYADMLNTVKMTEAERREAYFYIYSQGKRLESLSYKLMELTNVERHPLNGSLIDVKKLEENIRVTMRPVWEQEGIQGKAVFEKGFIWGDMDLILSLLYNLISNANKAVEKDGFVVLRGQKRPDGGYQITVVDNGRGIPKEEIGRVTEAFYMVDKSRARKQGGAGIGLALCQTIINQHKGTLKIVSNVGEGTAIRLYFPPVEKMRRSAELSGEEKSPGEEENASQT
ncbi:MAG: HAMP domain-containing histidine kinase [Lachnospiraceae bacterium]|nr:HAMP domain-containing histidine kinase [Lachnospiraceae bacterium]